ncbi:DUF1109 domain-containing protein [Rhizobium sp. NTR19]|uniref:DUF1109 domain-containing protein n=1 Tax=Neorhizobium turbinariae TaxID=2937795 RepID=A0ABT0IXA2_9HYPH|nr:DUF1109 domain-containing protein [Neorhizobium turbinariae]MCK8782507.1 DUF1109 domain-containing protein [Neorhizobium turbinariae]
MMSEHERQRFESTNVLIKQLALEAGDERTGGLRFTKLFAVALVIALLAAIAVVLATAGARADFSDYFWSWTSQFKVIGMLLLAAGAVHAVWAAVTPGERARLMQGVLPAGVFLLIGALLDRSNLPVFGAHSLSVVLCVGTIIAASLPALVVILIAMRRGIPTRLTNAGVAAGLLAGSVGALSYTIACLNDGATFVATWYPVAIAIVTLLGRAITPRALTW